MTGPTLLLMSWLACVPPGAGDSKPPATEFDGVWQEPTPPGAKPGPTATFTFTSEAIRIDLYGQVFRGTFTTERRWPFFSVIIFDVATTDGKRLRVAGIYHLENDTLCLRIGPEKPAGVVVGDDTLVAPPLRDVGQQPVPLTLMLEKVKK